jgi:hypothetical protein
MHRKEREDLARAVRLQMKVAKASVDTRQKELLADVERQLSAIYQFDDKLWADINRQALEAVRQADEKVAAICRERGIPEEFRPGLSLYWHGRGENAANVRRTELRKRAQTQIAAEAEAAKTTIEARAAEVLTALLADGLTSADARAFLESIPRAEQLIKPVVIPALQGARKLLAARADDAEEKPWK